MIYMCGDNQVKSSEINWIQIICIVDRTSLNSLKQIIPEINDVTIDISLNLSTGAIQSP